MYFDYYHMTTLLQNHMTHILKEQNQSPLPQQSVSYSNTRAIEWRQSDETHQGHQIIRITSCQPHHHKSNRRKLKHLVHQSIQKSTRPASECQYFQNNRENTLNSMKSGRPKGSQMVCQIDKTYLMRNFPLSYFENIDMLFRIKGKSKKSNTKSCNHINRKAKKQAQAQEKFKQERPYDERSDKAKYFQGQKENIKTMKWVSANSTRNQQKMQANKHLFTRKYKQIETITLNSKSRQIEREPNRTKSDNKRNPIINVDRFYRKNKTGQSKFGSDSRDTLYPPRYYSKNQRICPQLKKQQRNDLQECYRVITSPTTPKLSVEKSEKKLTKKRKVGTTSPSTKNNLFIKKRGFIQPENQTFNKLELSLLENNKNLPSSGRHSEDSQNKIINIKARQRKSETYLKKRISINQLNHISQYSRQEQTPLENQKIQIDEDAKTVKLGCQVEDVEILEPIKPEVLPSFKKQKDEKIFKQTQSANVQSRKIQMKSKTPPKKIDTRKVSPTDKKRTNEGIKNDKQVKNMVNTAVAGKQDEIKESVSPGQLEESNNQLEKPNKSLITSVNFVEGEQIKPCIFPESSIISSNSKYLRDDKQKSIYQEFIEEKGTQNFSTSLKPESIQELIKTQSSQIQMRQVQMRNNTIDEEVSSIEQTTVNELKVSPPLVTVNKINKDEYIPKSWIKDTLLQSEQQCTQKLLGNTIVPKKVDNPHALSSLQTSLYQKLQKHQPNINSTSSKQNNTSFGSDQVNNFCRAIIQREQKIKKGLEQFKQIEKILDTDSQYYNDTIAKRLMNDDNASEKKCYETSKQRQSMKSISKPVLLQTQSAQYINSVHHIKAPPQSQPKTVISRPSVFSPDSNIRSHFNQKKGGRHNTIAQNADEDLLQSNAERKVKFNAKIQGAEQKDESSDPGEGMLDSSYILDEKKQEKKTESHYGQHNELEESSIFINMENRLATLQVVKTETEKKGSDPSCLDMNSSDEAQLQRQINNMGHDMDRVIESKVEEKRNKIKAVHSEWQASDVKNQSLLTSSKMDTPNNMIVVNQRGSQIIPEPIDIQQGEDAACLTKSRSMKVIRESKKQSIEKASRDKQELMNESKKLQKSIEKMNKKLERKQNFEESICNSISKIEDIAALQSYKTAINEEGKEKGISEELKSNRSSQGDECNDYQVPTTLQSRINVSLSVKNIQNQNDQPERIKQTERQDIQDSQNIANSVQLTNKSSARKQFVTSSKPIMAPQNNAQMNRDVRMSKNQLHKMYDINIFNSCHQRIQGVAVVNNRQDIYQAEAKTQADPIKQKIEASSDVIDENKIRESEINKLYNELVDDIIDKEKQALEDKKQLKIKIEDSIQNQDLQSEIKVEEEKKITITKKNVKQVSCAIEVEYFDLLQSSSEKQQKKVSQPDESKITKHQHLQETSQVQIKNHEERTEEDKVGFECYKEDPQRKISVNKADAMMNTVDFLESSQKVINQPLKIAEISQYCQGFSLQIKKLSKSTHELNQKCWSIVSKILKFIIGGNSYFKRLIDDDSVWLYTDKKNHTFERFERPINIQGETSILKQVITHYLGSSDLNDNSEQKIVGTYLQLLIGMPILMVRQTCFNKLDNLYRHSNIFGFAYGKRHVWRIVGIVENKKKQKCVKLEKLNNKDSIELVWQKFQEDFKCAFISCFNTQYFNRGVELPEKKEDKGCILTLKLKIENEQANSKIHCMLGCDFGYLKNHKGKMIVYVKVKSEDNQEEYKYIGSGDLTLISMKLKPGEYMIILEVQEGNRGGQVLMGCSSGNVSLELDGGWRSKQNMI